MEDPSDEWSIQEYSAPEERNSRFRRIWNGGVWLGRKVVVAGVIVSSAPLVLPPLVALSALGVAFSLPFGFVFVSYACTEKVMGSLLKDPTSPSDHPMLGYKALYTEDEESSEDSGESYDEDDVKSGYKQDDDIEADEKEFEEDTKKGIEIRIELVDESDGEIKESDSSPRYSKDDLDTDEKDVIIEEDGYKEDIDECAKNLEAMKPNDVGSILEGVKEAEEEISSMKEQNEKLAADGVHAVLFAAEVGGENDSGVELVERVDAVGVGRTEQECDFKAELGDIEEDALKRETTGLIEAIRDEGKADIEKPALELLTEKTPHPTSNFDESSTQSGNGMGKGENRLCNDFRGEESTDTKKDKEIYKEEKGEVNTNVGGLELCMDINKENNDRVEGKRAEVDGVLMQGNGFGSEPLSIVTVPDALQADEENTSFGHLHNPVYRELKYSMENDLVANVPRPENTAASHARVDGVPAQHSESTSKRVDDETRMEDMTAFTGMPVAGNFRQLPFQFSPGVSMSIETQQEPKLLDDEENMWEQICAMRTIIGYQAVPNASWVEELKALYAFTGVEPPSSAKDIKEKLQFLKSIIGVK